MHLAIAFPDAVAKLTMQYRMHKDICHFSNLVAYKGELKCANEKVKNQKLVLAVERIPETNTDRQWIEHVVNPNNPVVFLDCEAEESVGPVNAVEVSIVEECAKSLTDCGVVSIGVITPFRSQVREFNLYSTLNTVLDVRFALPTRLLHSFLSYSYAL
jgi:superfamily I DNA and/or RNA helicase